MLDKEKIQFFHENGYQIFRNIIAIDIIEKVNFFLSSYISDELKKACKEIGCNNENEIVSYITKLAEVNDPRVNNLTKATRDTLSGHFSLATRLSSQLLNIATNQSIRSVLDQILVSNKLFLHLPPMARFVLPGNDYAGVPAHQDISYNKHITDFVTVWVPLVNIDELCGGVTVYHGSGNSSEIPIASGRKYFWLKGVSVDSFTPQHFNMKVGDILLLNKRIVHASEANRSERIRISIDFRVFNEQAVSEKHHMNLQTREVISPMECQG